MIDPNRNRACCTNALRTREYTTSCVHRPSAITRYGLFGGLCNRLTCSSFVFWPIHGSFPRHALCAGCSLGLLGRGRGSEQHTRCFVQPASAGLLLSLLQQACHAPPVVSAPSAREHVVFDDVPADSKRTPISMTSCSCRNSQRRSPLATPEPCGWQSYG